MLTPKRTAVELDSARVRLRSAASREGAPARRLRVLAVTREPALRERIQRLLADVPCDLASNLGAREALVEAADADIAIVDDAQGDHWGLKLATELHRAEPGLRVIVVLPRGNAPSGEPRAVDLGEHPPREEVEFAAMLRRAVAQARPRRGVRTDGSHRYALAIEAGNDGLWDWDLQANSMSFSSRWRKMLGLENEAVGNSPDEWFGRVHQDDVARLQVEIARLLHGEAESVEFECRMRHRDGSLRTMLVRALAVRDATDRVHRMAGSHTDMTAQKAAESRLLFGALHDPLTRLPNRELFHDRLRHAFERSKRDDGSRFAILFVDLDRFKGVNDSLGHQAGDELLSSVADRLNECVRASDTLARLGGDEFAVLAEEVTDLAQVVTLAKRMLEALSRSFRVSGRDIDATASIGIAFGAAEHESPGDVLRDADTAMYRAKSLGRARYEVFRGTMRLQAVEPFHCETELRRELDRGEFVLFYEPIVSLGSGQLVAFEAVLRWRDPARGWVPPAEFARVAQETGLVAPLERWALGEACRQLHRWDRLLGESFAIRVNLTATQLETDLVNTIGELLRVEGVAPRHLGLAIQEGILATNLESRSRVLNELRAMQIRVGLDDFGTRRVSLQELSGLPVDAVKMGRDFGGGLGVGGRTSNLVQSIVTLCRSLDIVVVADGVANLEDAAELRRLGCDQAQGEAFSPPVPESEATEMLERCRSAGRWTRPPYARIRAGGRDGGKVAPS